MNADFKRNYSWSLDFYSMPSSHERSWDNVELLDWNRHDFPDVESKKVNALYLKEIDKIKILHEFIKEGELLFFDLYTFRSIASCIPQNQSMSSNAETSTDLYSKTISVLQNQMRRLLKLFEFYKKATEFLKELLNDMSMEHKKGRLLASQELNSQIMTFLGLFLRLDSVKRMIVSANNDLSLYKRALNFVTERSPEMDQIQSLSLFMAQQDHFFFFVTRLFSNRHSVWDDWFMDIVSCGMSLMENHAWMTYRQRVDILLSLGLCLVCLDGEEDAHLLKRKRIKLDSIVKLFKKNEFLILFGDLVFPMSLLYGKCLHAKDLKWTCEPAESLYEKHIDLKVYSHQDFLECQNFDLKKIVVKDSQEIAAMGLLGLTLLSKLSSRLRALHAWKLTHPNKSKESASFYDSVVKFNYQESAFVLMEYISKIHHLSQMLLNHASLFQVHIDKYLSMELTEFIHHFVEEYSYLLSKKQKYSASTLNYIKCIGGSCKSGCNSLVLYLIRSLLADIIHEKSKGMKTGFLVDKDLKESQIQEIQVFLRKTFPFQKWAQFKNLVLECMDLSFLWLREYHLQMLPIPLMPLTSSLGFLLMEKAIKSKKPTVLRHALSLFSIYNTSGKVLLSICPSRHLWNELEAELNVTFNRMVLTLAQRIYTHFKKLLSFEFQNELQKTDHFMEEQVFISFMQVPQLFILGRMVPFQSLLSSHLERLFKESIDVALSRFESNDLTFFKEFQTLIQVTRNTHARLQEYLELEDMEGMLDQVNESVSCFAHGRVQSHIIHEIANDILPNYVYHQFTMRWTKSNIIFVEPNQRRAFIKSRLMHLYGSKNLVIAHGMQQLCHQGLVTNELLNSCLEFMGLKGFHVLSNYLLEHAHLILQHVLVPLLQEIETAIPKSFKLPLIEYGLLGSFEYFNAQLKSLLNLPEQVLMELFQSFREMGHCFLIFLKAHAIWNARTRVHLEFVFKNFQNSQLGADFHRLWSCLEFLYCSKSHLSRPVFGDGFHWSGLILLRLLNQLSLYDCLSINAHMLLVQQESKETPPSLCLEYLENAKLAQDISHHIISFLDLIPKEQILPNAIS